MKKVLTIAGSDCSGGAGIQADLKTMTVHGVYGMSAVTALTAQNTTGVYAVLESTPEFLARQLDCIFTDIPPDAVKIGMVSSEGLIEVIGEKLRQYKAKNVVLDPVMVATSGGRLMQDGAAKKLVEALFPLADLVTPNIPEAEVLGGMPVLSREDAAACAEKIAPFVKEGRGGVLIKGGHFSESAEDVLYVSGRFHRFYAARIETSNTHGTGCTLSSAIACNLANGYSLPASIQRAKNYLTGALQAGLDLGAGNGPLNHCYCIKKEQGVML